MAPLSILFVTTRFPDPIRTGDRVRAFQQIRLLGERHRITLATFDDRPVHEDARREVARRCEAVITVPFDRAAAARRLARGAFSDVPLQVAWFAAPELRARVRAAAAAARFDLLHVQLARALPLVEGIDAVPRVVDLVDALSLNMRRRAARDRAPWRWAAGVDARRLARYERRVCRDVHTATVVAAADRETIGAFPNLHVNANGVDLAEFARAPDPRPPATIAFTGNMGYYPNVEAACWFARDVLPRIWRVRPDARLVVAGVRPHRRVRALADGEARITVTGHVPRMRDPLAAARVAVAPMRSGSGQLLKVLEAMAVGTPVVATRCALSGIEAIDGDHVLVAEDAARFAAQVCRVLDDDELAGRLASRARNLVEGQYTWRHSVARLEALYDEVARAGHAAGSRP